MKKQVFLFIAMALMLPQAELHAQDAKGKSSDNVATIQDMPKYPGGDEAMVQDLMKNLAYPADKSYSKIGGIVYVSFVVESDGSKSNVKVERGIKDAPLFDEAALNAVGKLKNFVPATSDGKAIRQQLTLPVRFEPGT